MNSSIGRAILVSLTIWVCAVFFNAILGTIVLSASAEPSIFLVGLMFGAAFSFPVFLAILIVLYSCISKSTPGEIIVRQVFITGFVMTVLVFLAFMIMFDGMGAMVFALLIVALVSCAASISIHIGILNKLGSDYRTLHNQFEHEDKNDLTGAD